MTNLAIKAYDIIENLSMDGNRIDAGVTQCIKLTLDISKTKQIVAHKYPEFQDFGIRVWISRDPMGQAISELPVNLKFFSLSNEPSCIFLVENIYSLYGPKIQNQGLQVVVPSGEYWVNIQNALGMPNKYKLVISDFA